MRKAEPSKPAAMKKYFILIVFSGLFYTSLRAQPVTVPDPVSNKVYTLPDPGAAQTAAELQSAITTAETAARALYAGSESQKTNMTTAESDQAKAFAIKNANITATNNFNKNDVIPYKQDMDNYNAAGAKYSDLLSHYNKAVLANNALAAKDRKATTVAALNNQKIEIDLQSAQLSKWKDKLDAAKAKLDVKNAALQKQQQKGDALEQSSTAKLKACKIKLKGVLDQIVVCAAYAEKCRALLTSKFKVDVAVNTGYFNSPEYKNALVDLNALMDKLKSY